MTTGVFGVSDWRRWSSVITIVPAVASTGFHGTLALTQDEGGRWRIAMQPASVKLVARDGEPIRYAARTVLAEHEWRRLPVSGVSFEDARANVRIDIDELGEECGITAAAPAAGGAA